MRLLRLIPMLSIIISSAIGTWAVLEKDYLLAVISIAGVLLLIVINPDR